MPEPSSRCYDSAQVAGSASPSKLAAARTTAKRLRAGSGLLIRTAILLCAWLAFLAPARADHPQDVSITSESAPLPEAPDGYVREAIGNVTWEYHERARSVAHVLQDVYREEWPRVVAELGVEVDDALVIRIGRNPEEMAALAPAGSPPPSYATGVAYPNRGLVLLTLSAPETWERPDVESVLVHELSHVALHRAVNGHPIPRWFTEGVAIYQAREHDFDRIRTLWSGTASGRLVPLERLSRAFPEQPHRVNLAYAQSADFVRWLLARNDGEARFRELLGRLGRGQAFDVALERTYSIPVPSLETEWHDDLEERFQAWPLLFGSGGLWVLAALLIVVAYVRRKRRDRKKLRQWEEEEAADDALAAAQRAALESAVVLAPSADEERDILYVIPPEPRARESGVPTIEHEGRAHTLH